MLPRTQQKNKINVLKHTLFSCLILLSAQVLGQNVSPVAQVRGTRPDPPMQSRFSLGQGHLDYASEMAAAAETPIIDHSRPGPEPGNTQTNECPTARPVMRSSRKKLLFENDFSSEGNGGLELARNYKTGSYNSNGVFGSNFNTIYDTSLVLVYQVPNPWYEPDNGEQPFYSWSCPITYDSVDTDVFSGSACLEYVKQGTGNPNVFPTEVYRRDSDGNYITLYLEGNLGNRYVDDQVPSYTLLRDAEGNYTLTSFDGEKQVFRSDGKPLGIYDSRGVGITFNYAPNGRFTSVTHTSGRSIQFTWSEFGHITSVIAPNNKQFSYQYGPFYSDNAINQHTRIKLLSDVTYPDALGVRSYIYDGYSSVIGVKVNGTRITEYTYFTGYGPTRDIVSSGLVGGVEKSTFATALTTLAYSTTETNALGLATTHSYIGVNGQVKVGSISRAAASSCPGGAQNSTYDGRGFLATQTDWSGNKKEFQYDAKGRLVQEITGVGPNNNRSNIEIIRNTWEDATSRMLSTTRFARDSVTPLSKTVNEYFPVNDAAGRNLLPSATTAIDCTPNCDAGPRRRIEYRYTIHPNKMLATIEIDGPLAGTADTTRYNYSAQGDLSSVVNALGQTENYQNYNGLGQPGHVITTAGVGTTYNYDSKGRVASTVLYTLRGAITKTFQYDAEDRLTYVSDGHGWVRNIYDVQGRLVRVEKPGTNPNVASSLDVAEYTYNLLSQPTTITTKRIDTPTGGAPVTTVFSTANKNYNIAGMLISETGNNGQNMRYEYNSNAQLSVTYDSLNRSTAFYYDSHGRVNKVVSPVGTTHKGFDQLGRLSYVIDPNNNQTNYFYNNFNDVVREESPATGISTYAYDQAGRLISKSTADGRTTQYNLDLLGRSTTISSTWPTPLASFGSMHQIFTFDSCAWGAGKLCSVSDLTGSLVFEYDATAGVKRQQYNSENGKSYAYEYFFDGLDRPITQSYSDGSAIFYQYTPQGAVSQILARAGAAGATVSVANSIAYAPFGTYTNLNHSNGIWRAKTFDLDSRLTSISSGSVAIAKSYSYNTNNLITQITNHLDGGNSQNFTYDTVSRLTSLTTASGNQAFSYDANSNRTSHTWGGATDNYQLTTGNRLTGIAGARANSFVLDAVGNRYAETAAGVTTEHYYDSFNREIFLRRYTAAQRCEPNKGACEQLPAGTWQYGVNAFGLRAYKYTKSTAGQIYGLRHYMYGNNGNLVAEADGLLGTLQSEYIWLGNEPIGLIRNGEVFRIHTDHLNRPEAVSNNAGGIVWQAKNFAFDRVVVSDTIGGLNLGLPGQYFDSESNTWYNHHRQYDGLLGRYTQSDPIGLGGGLNTFGYVGGNPLSIVDPEGLQGFGGYGSVNMAPFYIQQSNDPMEKVTHGADFYNVSVQAYVFTGSLSLSRNGDVIGGAGVSRRAGLSVSANVGFIAKTCANNKAQGKATSEYLRGAGFSVSAYRGVGGALEYSPGSGFGSMVGVGLGLGGGNVDAGAGNSGLITTLPIRW